MDTTHAIESLYYSLRKGLKGRGAFPNGESIVKLCSMGLQHGANTWTQSMLEWKAALNQCVILVGERVPMCTKFHRALDPLRRASQPTSPRDLLRTLVRCDSVRCPGKRCGN